MAENNAKSAKPSGTAPSCSSDNTNAHKLMKMGKPSKLDEHGGKKTPA